LVYSVFSFSILALILDLILTSNKNILNQIPQRFFILKVLKLKNLNQNIHVLNSNNESTVWCDRNEITDEGVKNLCSALKHTTSLTQLYLTHNNISSEGIKFLISALNCLKICDLDTVKLNDDGLKEALSFNLNSPNILLRELSLSENNIGLEGATILSNFLTFNTTLRKISLAGNDLGDESLKKISEGLEQNSALEILNLYKVGMGSSGLKYLCNALTRNSTLFFLEVSSNNIGGEGAECISELISTTTTINTLYIRHCGMDARGCEKICKAMEGNHSIFSLRISGNGIDQLCRISIQKNMYLYLLDLGYKREDAVIKSNVEQRNSRLWKVRVKWTYHLAVFWRVFTLGVCEEIPMEIIYIILSFVVPTGVLKREHKKRIIKYASDISTLGKDRHVFLEYVFGRGL